MVKPAWTADTVRCLPSIAGATTTSTKILSAAPSISELPLQLGVQYHSRRILRSAMAITLTILLTLALDVFSYCDGRGGGTGPPTGAGELGYSLRNNMFH